VRTTQAVVYLSRRRWLGLNRLCAWTARSLQYRHPLVGGGEMKLRISAQVLWAACLVLAAWGGAFGIAWGVSDWRAVREKETIVERHVPVVPTKYELCQAALEGGSDSGIYNFCRRQGLP